MSHSAQRMRRGATRSTALLLSCVAMCISVRGASSEEDTPALHQHSSQTLIEFAFPTEITSSGRVKALSFRDKGYAFASLSEVYAYNLESTSLVPGSDHTIKLRKAPLESPWWWAIKSPEGARAFVVGLGATMSSERGDAAFRGSDVLSKALWQRDLIQVHALLTRARGVAADAATDGLARQLQQVLAEQIKHVMLSAEEYRVLLRLRPKVIPEGHIAERPLSLSDQYLPSRVVAADSSWVEIPHTGRAFRHFTDHGGRSSINVYLRARGLDRRGMLALWKELYREHGPNLHGSGTLQPMPLGFESMLVRSFGVYLSDGRFMDSTWPEEVIVRVFKYPEPQLDLTTSDFRGTLFYQYKMNRADLLRDPQSMGLRRFRDDDEQFYGFFGEVPDPTNSYSNATTTMRANCISCHSELFYGLSTIFSFERDPDRRSRVSELMPRRGGGFDVDTPAFRSLRAWLNPMPNDYAPQLKDPSGESTRGLCFRGE